MHVIQLHCDENVWIGKYECIFLSIRRSKVEKQASGSRRLVSVIVGIKCFTWVCVCVLMYVCTYVCNASVCLHVLLNAHVCVVCISICGSFSLERHLVV